MEMKHTIEKLKEYGLKLNSKSEKYEAHQKILHYRNEKETDLPIDFCSGMDIFIEDTELFKKRFEIPEKYNVFTDKMLTNICVDSKVEGVMLFHDPNYECDIEELIEDWVASNGEEFLKNNKRYQLKKAFAGLNPDEWLTNELVQLFEMLLDEPATLPGRKQLYEELINSLSKDQTEFRRTQRHLSV